MSSVKSIEDDEITCQIPTMRPEGDLGNQEFFIVSVTQAQLFSLIIKRLKTLKNSKPSLQDVTGTISDLHAATEQWYASVPESLKLNLATGRFSEAIHPVQGVFSLFAYYGCLLAIHSVLVHPWNAVPLDYSQCDKEELQRYVLNSTEIVVEASRNIIRNLKHVRINPSAPKRYEFLSLFHNLPSFASYGVNRRYPVWSTCSLYKPWSAYSSTSYSIQTGRPSIQTSH